MRSATDWSASANARNLGNDFHYDLYNGRVPKDQEPHGVRGRPIYVSGAGFDSRANTGRFALAQGSPGVSAAVPIPNFTDDYSGPAPDIGAHQRGSPPIRFGVRAKQKCGIPAVPRFRQRFC